MSTPNDTSASPRDARKLIKTATPGIYKKGSRYVVIFRAGGKQRKESARTLDQARQIKRAHEADRDRGRVSAALRGGRRL